MKVCAILILAFASPLFAMSPVPLLERQLQSFGPDLSSGDLWPLCQHIDYPCGLEELEINDPSLNGKPLGKPPAAQDVRGALDAIIARAPKYQWQAPEYVINVEPKEIPKEDPLERRIKRISLKEMSSTRAALNVLHATHALGSFQPPDNSRLRKIPNIELTNVSVREALNRIVVEDEHAMWVVSPTKNRGTLSLFFGVWNNTGVVLDNPDMKGPEYDQEMKRIRESLRKWNVR